MRSKQQAMYCAFSNAVRLYHDVVGNARASRPA
jgi:hypothetical protein